MKNIEIIDFKHFVYLYSNDILKQLKGRVDYILNEES